MISGVGAKLNPERETGQKSISQITQSRRKVIVMKGN